MKNRPILKAIGNNDLTKVREVLRNPAADLRPISYYDNSDKSRKRGVGIKKNEHISLLIMSYKKGDIEMFKTLLNDLRIHNNFIEIEFTLFYFSLGEKKVDSEYIIPIFRIGNKRAIAYALKNFTNEHLLNLYKPIHREDFINQLLGT